MGVLSLALQLLGFFVASEIPYDTQGAVGKAFAALFTQVAAIPTALVGLTLSLYERVRKGRFDVQLTVGLVCSTAGLIPLALIYVIFFA